MQGAQPVSTAYAQRKNTFRSLFVALNMTRIWITETNTCDICAGGVAVPVDLDSLINQTMREIQDLEVQAERSVQVYDLETPGAALVQPSA